MECAQNGVENMVAIMMFKPERGSKAAVFDLLHRPSLAVQDLVTFIIKETGVVV